MASEKGREEFSEGDLVIRTDTGERGYVVIDHYGVCSKDEIAVVYLGQTAYLGTDWRLLEKVSLN